MDDTNNSISSRFFQSRGSLEAGGSQHRLDRCTDARPTAPVGGAKMNTSIQQGMPSSNPQAGIGDVIPVALPFLLPQIAQFWKIPRMSRLGGSFWGIWITGSTFIYWFKKKTSSQSLVKKQQWPIVFSTITRISYGQSLLVRKQIISCWLWLRSTYSNKTHLKWMSFQPISDH